jgi:endo-1,4-beta-xylanase
MKLTKWFTFILLLSMTISSCASASPTETNQAIAILPLASETVISTTTNTQTDLFSGPSNLDYEVLETLPSGTTLIPLAIFGEFTEVRDQKTGQEGYVVSANLDPVETQLPVLTLQDVPWIKKDLIDYCAMPFNKVSGSQLIITSPMNDDIGVDSGMISLIGPVKFVLKMTMNNDRNGQISLNKPFASNTDSHEWYETIRFYIRVINHKYSIIIFDGTGPDSTYEQDLPYTDDQELTVTIDDPQGKTIKIADSVNNTQTIIDVATLSQLSLPDGLFPNKTMYINCEMAANSILTFDQHEFFMAPTGVVKPTPAGIPVLKDLAVQKGISLGAAIDWWNLASPEAKNVVQRTFTLDELTFFGWPDFWVGPGEYNYAYLDPVVDYYLSNGWKVRALHLVYGAAETLPDWLKNGNYTREEYIGFLEGFVKDNVTHYKGKITEYSLANEAVNAYGSRNDFWANVIGWDYVDMVFRWAHEADPDASLIFNADSNECIRDANTEANVNRMISWVKRMKNSGVPINAVGLEMHLLLPWNSHVVPTKECLVQTMNTYGSLGVDVYITELDVNTTLLFGSLNEVLAKEGEIYKTVMDACLESTSCKGIATFGVDDNHSWLSTIPEVYQEIDEEHFLVPLLFDANYLPKPAFYGFLESLQTH